MILSVLVMCVSSLNLFFIKSLVDYLQLPTHGEVDSVSILAKFTIDFFNKVVLILLLHANFSESDNYYLRKYMIHGKFSDFSTEWYNQIGPIFISINLFSSVWEPVMFLVNYGIYKLSIWQDRGWTSDETKTKCATKAEYLELYQGPQFSYEFVWAKLLTSVVLALVFGPCFPLLYPVTMLEFIVMYTY
jgi:hypothetical protein